MAPYSPRVDKLIVLGDVKDKGPRAESSGPMTSLRITIRFKDTVFQVMQQDDSPRVPGRHQRKNGQQEIVNGDKITQGFPFRIQSSGITDPSRQRLGYNHVEKQHSKGKLGSQPNGNPGIGRETVVVKVPKEMADGFGQRFAVNAVGEVGPPKLGENVGGGVHD